MRSHMLRLVLTVGVATLFGTAMMSFGNDQWVHKRVMDRYLGVHKVAEPTPSREPTAIPDTFLQNRDRVLDRHVPEAGGLPAIHARRSLTCSLSKAPTSHPELNRSTGQMACQY